MEHYLIEGGKSLRGEVKISGAKNVAGKLVLASILTEEACELTNFPAIGETEIALELARAVGAQIQQIGDHLHIHTKHVASAEVTSLSRKNRLPILAIGPLVHRVGEARIPKVGGDKIGPRPVDYHIEALRKLGIDVIEEESAYLARANNIKGAKIDLPYPSVGATENILLVAVLAKGETVITNAAMEPEVMELIVFLQKMGAHIYLEPSRTIVIEGVDSLSSARHWIMPDRLEAVSYAAATLATAGDVYLRGAYHKDMITFLGFVKKIGGQFQTDFEGIRVWSEGNLQASEITTDVHPGFMTDWQQPAAVCLLMANGQSIIHETVYEDRLGYLNDLSSLGARVETSTDCLGIKCRFNGMEHNHSARITGPNELHAGTLHMPDVRAGMAYIIAALTAHGDSELTGVEHLDRGYENLQHKLRGLGAVILRKVTK